MDSSTLKKRKQRKYFKYLAKTGAKCASARAAGFGTGTLRRLRRDKEDWVKCEDAAILQYVEKLEVEVDRRGFRGIPHGIYYEGERVATERRYSDGLAMFRLKGLAPEKYADRTKATVEHGGQVIIHIPDNGREKNP